MSSHPDEPQWAKPHSGSMAKKTSRKRIIAVGDAEYAISDLCAHIAAMTKASKPVRYQPRPGGGRFKSGNKTVAIHKGGAILSTDGRGRLELPPPLDRRDLPGTDAPELPGLNRGPRGKPKPLQHAPQRAVQDPAQPDKRAGTQHRIGTRYMRLQDMINELGDEVMGTIEYMLNQRMYKEALEYVEDRLRQNPRDMYVMSMKSEVLMRTNRMEEADAVTDRMLEMDPNDLMATMSKYDVLDKQGRHEEAREFMEKQFWNNPDSIDMEEDWLSSLCKTGRHEEALEYVDSQLRLPDKRIIKQTQQDKIISGFINKIMPDPRNLADYQRRNMYQCRAKILKDMGRHDEALEALDQAIEIIGPVDLTIPEPPDGIRGNEFAMEIFKISARSPRIMMDMFLGEKMDILVDAGRYDEALECCNSYFAKDDPLKRAYERRGAILFRAGRYEEAVGALRVALDANPDEASTLVDMANALLGLSRYSEARDMADRALRESPDSADARLVMDRALQGEHAGS